MELAFAHFAIALVWGYGAWAVALLFRGDPATRATLAVVVTMVRFALAATSDRFSMQAGAGIALAALVFVVHGALAIGAAKKPTSPLPPPDPKTRPLNEDR